MYIGYAAATILFLVSAAGMTLEKAYFYLPIHELKRRSGQGDKLALRLASAATFGDELRLLLVVLSWLAAAAGLVLLIRSASLLVSLSVTLLVLVVIFFWQVRSPLTAPGARFAGWCSPAFVWLLPRLSSVLQRPAKLFRRYHLQRTHTGLYESEDLARLLERQGRQRDNRIPAVDLQRMAHVLEAARVKVRSVMTSRTHVMLADAADAISPVLIDELHRSGHSVFPVFEGKQTNLVGTLRLGDVADVKQHGTVGDVARHQLAYVNQNDTLETAVRAFYETHQQLLIVLNSESRWIGVLTLNDILMHIFGRLDALAFGHFDDPVTVAHKKVVKD